MRKESFLHACINLRKSLSALLVAFRVAPAFLPHITYKGFVAFGVGFDYDLLSAHRACMHA
jgi:hypothetical protein